MKALIVGAGAVGQVYGRHLQQGGAEVSFFVRPKYASECEAGFALYPLNRRHPRAEPARFKGAILTRIEDVAAQSWDQVHLCVSSPALRGPWLDEILQATKDATIVMLQPGLEDQAYVQAKTNASRVVTGLISMISYHAPLPGEKVAEPGTAYWFPPMSPSLYSGDRAQSVAKALAAGGCPAKTTSDVARAMAYPAAALQLLVAALEESDWSFDKLLHSENVAIACAALKETCAMLDKKLGARTPFGVRAISPLLIRTLLPIAMWFIPLDFEIYMRSHFTKVGDQTRAILKTYVETTKALKLPSHQLEALNRRLPA